MTSSSSADSYLGQRVIMDLYTEDEIQENNRKRIKLTIMFVIVRGISSEITTPIAPFLFSPTGD